MRVDDEVKKRDELLRLALSLLSEVQSKVSGVLEGRGRLVKQVRELDEVIDVLEQVKRVLSVVKWIMERRVDE